ncbi:MAG: TolC family protein [candidate division Zixibacteria bacterium]|nr:TolC family protein [candidate division Zixibacteria bacterium]
MRATILITVVLLLTSSEILSGEPKRITLDEAVRIALRENYELRSSYYDLNARRWGLRNAVTQFFPRVTFSTVFTRVDETTFRNQNAPIEFIRQLYPDLNIPLIPRNSYSSDVTVTQPIYNGGSLWANLSAARSGRNASVHAYSEAKLSTILETKRAFFDVLRSEDLLDVWRKSVGLAEKYLESALHKRSLGMISNADVLRWKLQLAENRTGLIEAENSVVIASVAFSKTIGAELDAEFELDHLSEDQIERTVETVGLGLDDDFDRQETRWKEEALANSPALKSVQAASSVERALYRQKYSLFQPSVNFNYRYMWQADDDLRLDGLETWRASVILSFPLFSSLGDYTSLKEARDDLLSAEASEREFERTVLLQVVSTASKLRSALRQVDAAGISRDLARENAKIVEDKFGQGLIDNLNLIDAQVAQTTAEARYVSAIYDFLIAQAEIDKLLGRQTY